MARKTYGNTWWGKQWIEALERIDSNRLSRGKSYANTGKVLNIKFNKNTLSAKVAGSWASYYNIKINLKPFSKDEKKKFYEIIENNSSIALDLSLGNLPENLLNLLKKEKIDLLPKRWSDIEANCSCPDYANPCKHLAAVYYMLANEIDKDPFILLELRGINKEEIHKIAGISESENITAKKTFLSKFIDFKDIEFAKKEINAEEFSFSFTKFEINNLLKLLKDNPLFYIESNFKEFLGAIYNIVSTNVNNVWDLKEETLLNKGTEFYITCKEIQTKKKQKLLKTFFIEAKNLSIDEVQVEIIKGKKEISKNPINYFLNFDGVGIAPMTNIKKNIIVPDKKIFKQQKLQGYETNLASGLNYFLDLPLDIDIEDASDSFMFLNTAASLAMGLVKANLYVPEVFYDQDPSFENFSIRYIPFLNNEIVKNQVFKLQEIMPANICQLEDKILKPNTVIDILSLFITFIVNKCMSWEHLTIENKVLRSFFLGETFLVEEFNEKNIGKAVENWLNKLQITGSDISPVIRFEFVDTADFFRLFVDVNKKGSAQVPVEYKKIIAESQKKKKQVLFFDIPADKIITDISKQLVIASEYLPELKEIVDSKGQTSPLLDLEQMGKVLSQVAGLFHILGIEMTIPKELKKLAYPQLQLKAKSKGSAEKSYLTLDDLLDFSYEISLGDKTISPAEFKKLLKSTKGLVKFKDQYLLLNPDEVNNIINRLKEPPPELNSPMQALFAAVSGEINGIKFQPDTTLKNILNDLTKVEDINIPETLNAKLRGYQERGYKWLYSNSKKHLGSCIADDMGLGKTIQIITLLLQYKKENQLEKPALVICPTTLIGNWQKECQKFAPSLNIEIYHGAQRQFNVKNKDVILSSYGVLRRDLKKLQAKEWSFLIIDEAQNIKNAETDQTKAVKSLKADNYIAMTGTPVENRLTELWNIFDFTNKGYMGNISSFKKSFSTPIEKYKDKESIELLKKATAPFMIRRLKTDKTIISDLPDKVIFDEYCYLSKEQAAVYENIVQETMKTLESKDGIERKGLIFKLITALKQICNHPANYSKNGDINSDLSGKALKTISVLENILANKEKSLIFTQFKEMGDILQKMIEKELKTEALFFHGGISRKKRDEMVDSFQNDKHKKLMIVSLKAGGTGLNLTAASNVIHYDLWWNPAVENQATDRVYRIGQEKNVIVHRLITLGTFEEKIDEIIKSKKELADLTVSTGEQWITEMSNRELKEIFSLHKV